MAGKTKTKKKPVKAKSKLKPAKKPVKKRGFLRRAVWAVFKWSAIGFAVLVALVLLLRFVNPPHGFYIQAEKHRLGSVKQVWMPMGSISRSMALSVVAAEDANFCEHNGFDIEAIKDAWEGGAQRGGSTISQQVAKNVFLWQGRSWLRKGLEAGFTVLIETLWPKKRILEVYLNVAEFDEGVFGVHAAGRHYFGVEAARISELQGARLASILPNPKQRSASKPSRAIRQKTGRVMSGARTIEADGRASCF